MWIISTDMIFSTMPRPFASVPSLSTLPKSRFGLSFAGILFFCDSYSKNASFLLSGNLLPTPQDGSLFFSVRWMSVPFQEGFLTFLVFSSFSFSLAIFSFCSFDYSLGAGGFWSFFSALSCSDLLPLALVQPPAASSFPPLVSLVSFTPPGMYRHNLRSPQPSR